ncbi:MAG: hypothetical protein AAFV53_12505 [Myxococcota bacterium]
MSIFVMARCLVLYKPDLALRAGSSSSFDLNVIGANTALQSQFCAPSLHHMYDDAMHGIVAHVEG